MVAAYTVLFLCAIFATWMFRVDVDGSAIRVRTNRGRKYELHCSDIDKIVCSKSDSGKRGPQFYITVTAKTNKFTLNANMTGFDTMAGYLLEMLESGELKRSAVAPSCKKRLQIHREGFYYQRKKKLAKPSAEMKEKTMNVMYNGIPCRLLEYYMQEGDGPYVMIENSSDIDKTYKMGFDCLGYPTEIAKKISKEEYAELRERGYLCSENMNTPE